jgi:hypothetical protein
MLGMPNSSSSAGAGVVWQQAMGAFMKPPLGRTALLKGQAGTVPLNVAGGNRFYVKP